MQIQFVIGNCNYLYVNCNYSKQRNLIIVKRTRFIATFETYRVGGKNKLVLVDGPKFDRHNSEKAVDAVAQVKLSWDTDYKHNK